MTSHSALSKRYRPASSSTASYDQARVTHKAKILPVRLDALAPNQRSLHALEYYLTTSVLGKDTRAAAKFLYHLTSLPLAMAAL
eukprot:1161558-Pelagomonas_calceolata.AAC.2